MKRRGAVLIELLVGSVVTGIVLTVLLQGIVSLWRMQAFGFGMPSVQDDARDIALRLADALRDATLCTTTDGGCTVGAAVEATSSTGFTVYRRNADATLSKLLYGVSGGGFTLTTSGTTTGFSTGAGLTLTYYSSADYNSNGLAAYTPTDATAKSLVAVGIVSTVTRNGLTGRFETLVRLRNSPKP